VPNVGLRHDFQHLMLYTTSVDVDDRPHQLALTGDQIYSDDVSEVLLFMLEDANKYLVGLPENFQTEFNVNLNREDLKKETEFRREVVEKAGLTAYFGEYGYYHLMKLGEFYSMYLFAWSDVLWGDQGLPGFNKVREDLPTTESDSYDPYHPLPLTRETKKYSNFLKNLSTVQDFKRTLPAVRRALANIPVYMMFDDHEVTDDWFLNWAWCERILGSGNSPGIPLGKRILQNGLTAFGIFQAWGNTPDYFSVGEEGGTFLDKVQSLSKNPSMFTATIQDIQNSILPTIVLDTPTNSKDQGAHLAGSLTWNFNISFDSHQIIAIDPRTQRGFVNANSEKQKNRAPLLLSKQAMTDQFATIPNSSQVTFAMVPAPIIGHPVADFFQRNISQGIFEGQGKASANDQEAWALNRWDFHNILLKLATFSRVIVLSGDVHYGYSSSLKIWDNQIPGANNEIRASIVQLTASSLKNETGLTRSMSNEEVLNARKIRHVLGWNSNNNPVYYDVEFVDSSGGQATIQGKVKGYPPQVKRRTLNGNPTFKDYTQDPDYQFEFFFLEDSREEEDRGTYDDSTINTPPGLDKVRFAAYQKQRGDLSSNTEVVGRNNIGLVQLTWNDIEKKVHHSFWFNTGVQFNPPVSALIINDAFNPYTIHNAEDFNLPLSGDKPYQL